MPENKHLFLLTIGPVQSFIKQARKTHDLFAGSRLLADLTIKACQEFEKQGELIYPQVPGEGDWVPNRFMGIVEGEKDIDQLGKDLKNTLTTFWHEAYHTVFQQIKVKELLDDERVLRQLNNHLEIYWVAHPIEGSYKDSFKAIEKKLAALKNTKNFSQLGDGQGEVGRKCSVDGQYNALFFGHGTKDNFTRHNKGFRMVDRELTGNIQIDQNEGLSALSFFKRFYQRKKQESYPSTADITLLNTFHHIKKDQELSNLAQTTATLIDGSKDFTKLDGQLWMEESLTKHYFDKNQFGHLKGKLPSIRNAHRDFKEGIKNQNLKLPSYFAIMASDGDSMGKWLSGEMLQESEKDKTQKFQEKMSSLLKDFADQAGKIIDSSKGNGHTVYAGGDDYLGLLNLNCLFDSIIKLNDEFTNEVNAPLQKEFHLEKDFTFSGGVAIAHYKEPLGLVLDEASKAEKAAKNVPGKHALCISIIKSNRIQAKLRIEQLKDLKHVWLELLNGHFSSKFLKNLYAIYAPLLQVKTDAKKEEEKEVEAHNLNPCMMFTDLRRLLKRGQSANNEEQLKAMQNACEALWPADESGNQQPITAETFRDWIHCLELAEFLTRETFIPKDQPEPCHENA